MAEPGAVAFQFERKGVIRATFTGDADEAMLSVIDAGAEDAEVDGDELSITTNPKELVTVRDALTAAGFELKEAELSFVASNTIEITDKETARKLMNLMNALDDLDDVTNVHANFTLGEGIDGE
jgi:transcriptional/translational regulatory protein YebC/TACO1